MFHERKLLYCVETLLSTIVSPPVSSQVYWIISILGILLWFSVKKIVNRFVINITFSMLHGILHRTKAGNKTNLNENVSIECIQINQATYVERYSII